MTVVIVSFVVFLFVHVKVIVSYHNNLYNLLSQSCIYV